MVPLCFLTIIFIILSYPTGNQCYLFFLFDEPDHLGVVGGQDNELTPLQLPMSFTVGHFADPMGASSAVFPPFSVVEIAPLSLSHLIHALENNSALECRKHQWTLLLSHI
jgi:hypothetical protein